MFVIDASITLAWAFDDESSAAADVVLDRLEREEALAPAHWPLEDANALRTAERRGRLGAGDLARLRGLLAALPVEIAPVELSTALGSVLEAARTNDLSAYDAAYLDLALVRGLPLATVDVRLRAACTDGWRRARRLKAAEESQRCRGHGAAPANAAADHGCRVRNSRLAVLEGGRSHRAYPCRTDGRRCLPAPLVPDELSPTPARLGPWTSTGVWSIGSSRGRSGPAPRRSPSRPASRRARSRSAAGARTGACARIAARSPSTGTWPSAPASRADR